MTQEILAKGNVIFYAYLDGVFTKLDMEQQGNLFVGNVKNIEYIVAYVAANEQQKQQFVIIVKIVCVVVLVILSVLAWRLLRRKKKRLALLAIVLAVACLVVLILLITGRWKTKEIVTHDTLNIEVTTESESASEEAESLSGSRWWEDYEISRDYFLNGNGSIALEIFVAESNDLETNAFCVELYDDEGHYITTTSQGDAWFAGTEGVLTGMEEAAPVVPGSTVSIEVCRQGNRYTLEYYDKESGIQLLKFVAEENGMFLNTIKVRVMAQVGDYEVKVLGITSNP